jgi:molecular chaperone HtpG
MPESTETHRFQADVNQVLSLVVNSLYTHKEVFLRELISNASDALDQLGFRALTDASLYGDDRDLRIEIVPDRDARALTIRDNGAGMSHDDLVTNLGTIAHSGTKRLIESLSGDQRKDLPLIGQFGVGFYAAFLVADRVTVTSRAAGAAEAWRWESDAQGEFTVTAAERASRGTDVTLHLKDGEDDFLRDWTLRDLVRRYSDFVRHPIKLQVVRKKEGEPDTTEWERINQAEALWVRPKAEITKEQYDDFYKHLTHDWEPPLGHAHFKVEGVQEMTGLLYIPRKTPLELLANRKAGVRLFVRRVFIMDDCEALLPEWLRFLRGVVDSDDLPLNVSREFLQKDRGTDMLRRQVVRHALRMLEDLAEEGETTEKDAEGRETKVRRYELFWRQYGRVLKEGIHADHDNRDKIAKLLRFESTHGTELVSLADYVTRMKPDQPAIYHVGGESRAAAEGSPHIEALRRRGYEVLLFTDPVDEWTADGLREFEGRKLVSAARGALDLPAEEEEKKKLDEDKGAFADLLVRIKKSLGRRIEDVRITNRLTDSPACLVTDEHGISPQLERLMRANRYEVPEQRRTLEINPAHPVVQRLRELSADESNASRVDEILGVLHDQALVAEGGLPEDPSRFAKQVTKLLEEVTREGVTR